MYYKLVQSGKLIETYEYNKFPVGFKRRKSRTRKVSREPSTILLRRRDNVYRLRHKFIRIVRSNLDGSSRPKLCTVTFRESVQVEKGYCLFTRFIQRLRYRFGKSFRYIAVPEYGVRGTKRLHFHLLLWDVKLKNERKSRYLAKVWKHGFVDVKTTDGSFKLAFYLGKYLTKSLCDIRFANQKAYSGSRNLLKPVSVVGNVKYWGDIISVNDLVSVNTYRTKWMGRCTYKKYECQ